MSKTDLRTAIKELEEAKSIILSKETDSFYLAVRRISHVISVLRVLDSVSKVDELSDQISGLREDMRRLEMPVRPPALGLSKEDYAELRLNQRGYEKVASQKLPELHGQFGAFSEGKLVAHGPTEKQAFERAKAQVGNGVSLYIRQFPDPARPPL